MPLTSAQLKGRIKSLASKNNANARKIISEIIDIDLGDEMTFSIKAVENIMDEMEDRKSVV